VSAPLVLAARVAVARRTRYRRHADPWPRERITRLDPDRLRAVPLFATMDAEHLRRIATFAAEDSAAAGTTLLREGDYSNELIAIEEGTADVLRQGRRLASLGPGDVFGEIGVLENELRTASVVATSPMRLVKLSTWDVRRLGPDTKARLQEVVEERRRQGRAGGALTKEAQRNM
jgi:CRP/FNR family cyclic AMP-dependent transcriptional regulator